MQGGTTRSAAGLPSDPGLSGWQAILPPAPPRASLAGSVTADWVVVGAGFAGLSAARRLAELHRGDRVVVLEAAAVAEGPAGRNSGFMIDVPHDLASGSYAADADQARQEIRLNRAGIAYAQEAAAEYGMSDCTLLQSGKINAAVSRRGIAHNELYAAMLERLSEPYQRLGQADMQQLTGTSVYQDGLYNPGTVTIQPAMYIRELAAGVETAGVSIHEQSPVVALTEEGNGWSVRTPQGRLSTPVVILAVNGHLQSFGFMPRRLIHVYTYASMTRALSAAEVRVLGGQPNWALTPADPFGTTVRRFASAGGDRIVIRNRVTWEPSLEVDEAKVLRLGKSQDKSFRDRFPMLGQVSMQYRWGGRLCLSKNSVPVFGEIADNLFAACCQNGLGTAKGTIAGRLVAELASGQHSALLADQLSYPLPTRLPIAPIATLGASLRLRWGEVLAGREL